MRAVCCICSDFFENNEEVSIAAAQCGHTFHTDCLMKWLETSSTCPHCRKRVNKNTVIKKLFFDVGEDAEEEVVDSDKLKNELSSMKLKLMQKEKEKKCVMEEKNDLVGKIREVEKTQKDLESSYKQEQSMNTSLRSQLKFHQMQHKSLEVEKEECRRIKEKLTTLKDLETILKGILF